MIDSLREEISILDAPLREKVTTFFEGDLKSYIDLLNSTETTAKNNPFYSTALQTKLNKATFHIVKKGYELELSIPSKKTIKAIKMAFRANLAPWINKSLIMKRGLEKPRGYAGDYQMLEYIYDGNAISTGIGLYLDKGFLDSELTVAVRNRKSAMLTFLEQRAKKGALNILNLASGPCREIKELSHLSLGNRLKFTCVDFDEEALQYSRKTIPNTEQLNIDFVKEDILKLIKNKNNPVFANQDLIYSIGLVDYLPDRFLTNILRTCLDSLKSTGQMIISFKDRDVYNPLREDWLTDWQFIPRNEQKAMQIIQDVGGNSINIEVTREPSKIIMFMTITKR
jgi:extracellular factor (EF) 3-hydroxypalmitic acid methyl ester biosynthesis protein